jgi:tripartite-type tricarboxylate transporter receptor subunit TctC
VSNNHVVFPSVYKSVPFDPIADITPVSVVGSTPFLLVANPSRVKARTVQELIQEMQARPDEYTYASSGNGTILHLAVEMFVHQAGVKGRHIPYRGVGPMMNDLIGGQVDIGVLALPAVRAQVESGALRALGACGDHRMPLLPELPTLAEQGLSNYECSGWFAAVAPANLPEADVQRMYQALKEAFNAPEVQKRMQAQGNTIFAMDPAKTAAFFKSEMAKYAQIVKASGLEPV